MVIRVSPPSPSPVPSPPPPAAAARRGVASHQTDVPLFASSSRFSSCLSWLYSSSSSHRSHGGEEAGGGEDDGDHHHHHHHHRPPHGHASSPSSSPRILFESPGDKAGHVESVRGWRAMARAERDAGIVSSMGQVLIPFFRCTLCGICIGPGYYEQEVYLYPVAPGEEVCLRDDAMHAFPDGTWLFCCGGCARHPRRMLPEFLRLVDATCWSTTRLISAEGERIRPTNIQREVAAIRIALTTYVLVQLQYLLTLMALSLGGLSVLSPILSSLSHPSVATHTGKRTNTHERHEANETCTQQAREGEEEGVGGPPTPPPPIASQIMGMVRNSTRRAPAHGEDLSPHHHHHHHHHRRHHMHPSVDGRTVAETTTHHRSLLVVVEAVEDAAEAGEEKIAS